MKPIELPEIEVIYNRDAMDLARKSKARFVQRINDSNRQTIPDWENSNKVATHKLSWATDENGNAIVYPDVLEIDGLLHDFTDPKWKHGKWDSYDNAIKNNNYIKMTPELALWYTLNYKKYSPGFDKYYNGGRLIPKGLLGWFSKVKETVRDGLNTAGEYYDRLVKEMDTPYTATALDEMGRPIMQTNGQTAKVTSTPKKDVTTIAAGVSLPVSAATVGIPATVGGIVGGMATGYVGNKAGRKVAKVVGANEKALEMVGDVGEFIGSIPGGVAGTKVGLYAWNAVRPNLFGPDGKIFNSKIPYKPENYYRGVNRKAILDAENTGVLRGYKNRNGDYSPYFGRGKGFEDTRYVIEGSPKNNDWISADYYRKDGITSSNVEINALGQKPEVVKLPEFPYTYDDGTPILYESNWGPLLGPLELIDKKLYSTEAFPYVNGTTIVPTSNFTYYKKYPLFGWRQRSFKK